MNVRTLIALLQDISDHDLEVYYSKDHDDLAEVNGVTDEVHVSKGVPPHPDNPDEALEDAWREQAKLRCRTQHIVVLSG